MSVSPFIKKAPTMMLARVPQTDRVSLIGGVPFFEVLDASTRKVLADRVFPRQYEHNETICGQGDYGHTMFIIVSGSVRIEAVNDQGQPVVLAKLGMPGQYFGEVALLGRARRTASVIADANVSFRCCTRDEDLPTRLPEYLRAEEYSRSIGDCASSTSSASACSAALAAASARACRISKADFRSIPLSYFDAIGEASRMARRWASEIGPNWDPGGRINVRSTIPGTPFF